MTVDVLERVSLRPPLKWAGGKRWQVPYLRPIWESHGQRRLVEPFCGGLAVALGLGPEKALLNDSNPHLHAGLVRVVALEEFIALANGGKL